MSCSTAGLFQGRRAEAHALNASSPSTLGGSTRRVEPRPHRSHRAASPAGREGFHGPIYTTPATRDLSAVMLADAAHIQEKDYEFLQRRGKTGAESEPLYTLRDAIAVQDLMVGVPYRRVFYRPKTPGDRVPGCRPHPRLRHASTSASAKAAISVCVFSGDIGRNGLPIVRDPEPPSGPIDTLIVEATYADRDHESFDDARRVGWREAVRRVAARGGKVLIPAFARGKGAGAGLQPAPALPCRPDPRNPDLRGQPPRGRHHHRVPDAPRGLRPAGAS